MKAPSSRVIVDLDAYAANLAVVRGMIPPRCAIMAVVKANAYGHGAAPIAKRAVREGARMLGVADVNEAVELREAGLSIPILVMVQPLEDALPAIVEYGLHMMASSVEIAERVGELARRANKVAPVHCKIDTGMGRQGFGLDQAVKDMMRIMRISHVDIEGVATHFPVADDSADLFTAQQIRQFKQLLNQLDKEGVPYETAHAANSAAIVNHPASSFDMVRPGLMTYGVWPTDVAPSILPVRPVLRWETRVTQIREIPRGASVGYGRAYIAPRVMKAALLPVGYADGYLHSLSNRGVALIRGARCPVRGSVCMDQILVDVTDVAGAAIGDVATLIGQDGDQMITAAELARLAQTIPYEILAGIGSRAQRVYVGVKT
ncbi:MAG TPA: alanine racemase [Candidatus Hydrogenedentes bacterium]|nr:alanine racemase [Candidatus Hydrogenedentota bacterium]HOS03006.1 alanine racemase [Candidatus Hydrogenedentota bacterium]